eukprot:4970517-Alexandrium_andersonii.AAC.1
MVLSMTDVQPEPWCNASKVVHAATLPRGSRVRAVGKGAAMHEHARALSADCGATPEMSTSAW